MSTVLRIGHLDINNEEGIPAGPYCAARMMEHSCSPGHWENDYQDWIPDEGIEDCNRCKVEDATDAIFEHTDETTAPEPDCDGIEFLGGYHHSGFESFQQLEGWMGQVLEILQDAGFALFIYESQDIVRGGHQVAFPGHRAELVNILPLI